MNELIERKNALLRSAGRALEEIWEISRMLEHVHCDRHMDEETLRKLANYKIKLLSVAHDDLLNEANISEPEAKESPYVPPVEDTEDVLI